MRAIRDGAGGADRLASVFANPIATAQERHAAGSRVVCASWPTVPWELIHAAGLSPLVLRQPPGPTPRADARLEPGVFSSRVRALIDRAVAGDLRFLEALVLPRTSEQDYKAYLYLREFAREGSARDTIPALHLFDLLQTDSPEARAYGLERMAALRATLEAMTGMTIATDDLEESVAASNRARAAARELLAFRRHPARVSGSEVFPLLAAFWLMPHDEYADAAFAAAGDLTGRRVVGGPRILLAGAPVDHTLIHREVERHGAVVVAEDTPWGTRAAGRDIETGVDPLGAIFDKYYADVASPRTPAASNVAWFDHELAGGIDGVVFSLPPDDSVFGWDYPAQRRRLDTRGIPSLLMREDPSGLTGDEATSERISAFIVRAAGHAAGASRG